MKTKGRPGRSHSAVNPWLRPTRAGRELAANADLSGRGSRQVLLITGRSPSDTGLEIPARVCARRRPESLPLPVPPALILCQVDSSRTRRSCRHGDHVRAPGMTICAKVRRPRSNVAPVSVERGCSVSKISGAAWGDSSNAVARWMVSASTSSEQGAALPVDRKTRR